LTSALLAGKMTWRCTTTAAAAAAAAKKEALSAQLASRLFGAVCPKKLSPNVSGFGSMDYVLTRLYLYIFMHQRSLLLI
jgi:hypothetical protein